MERPSRRTLMKSSLLPFAGILGLPSLSAAVQEASSPYRRPKLKITEIRTAEVRVHGYQVHVRVYTDGGIVGQGETTDASAGNVPLIRSFSRMLIGQDPLSIEAAFERIRTSGVFAGAQAGQYVTALTGVETALWDIAGKALGVPVYQLLGGRVRIRTSGVFAGAQAGQYVTALTGVEIALWDLAGKALGLPVYQLLGGKVRRRVRVYCDSGAREMIPGDERSKQRIQEIRDMGFTAAKIDIDDAADPARLD